MKNAIYLLGILLLVPMALAIYGGETYEYEFGECDKVLVNISAEDSIDVGEYWINNSCQHIKDEAWLCDCDGNFTLSIQFRKNTVNNYSIDMSDNYTIDWQKTSNTGGVSSSRSSRSSGSTCSPKWNCSEWGNCMSGDKAERKCVNTNNCNLNKPKEERYCYYPKGNQTTTTPIKQPIEPIEELTEPLQITEQEDKGMALGWKIAIGVFILLAIGAIWSAIKNREEDNVEEGDEE